mgnify:CR=1 FL=1
MTDPIPIVRPSIDFTEVEQELREVMSTGILTSGPYVSHFEEAVAEFVGVQHAIATTSATTALHLSMAALGVGPGDEVLVPDFTFPATANAVIQTGATPVFVDSSTKDFGMDPECAASLVSGRTRVIMPVDPFGQPADHQALTLLAADAGAHLVVDAACSLGAVRDNRKCGAHGDLSCFSFHPRKVVTCGEGGMVTTNSPDLAARLRLLRNHGATRKEEAGFEFAEPGYNYRLSEMPAVLGLAQMRRVNQILEDRRSTARIYDRVLDAIVGVTIPAPPPGAIWSYQSYVVILDDHVNRDAVIAAMRATGIETTIGTYACHQHPAFANWCRDPTGLVNAGFFADHTLTIPLLPNMDEGLVEKVAMCLNQAVSNCTE